MIIIGSDHAGVEAKEKLIAYLKEKNETVVDEGPASTDSVDYPDFAQKVCAKVLANQNALGILICGTGIGMSISANKINGIRAAMVTNSFMAEMTRRHNNANVLCFGSKVSSIDEMKEMMDAWLSSSFEGDRHQRRIEKIHQLENCS